MSEKRFELTKINPTVNPFDTVYLIIDYENPNKEIRTLKDCVDLLNEQQEFIEELQVSDEMGWKRAEHFEKKCPKELHNKKMYIKRLEYKVQKFKEMNGEQQATINELQSIIDHIKCEEDCFDYDYCCETVCSLYNEIKHLKEENEQLKHYKLYGDNKRLQTIIANLKEENEQLRKELNEIKENPINYF